MKIAILTTETPHHNHFVRALKERYDDVMAFCETAPGPKFPFATHHPFEDARDDYEWSRWFDGKKAKLADIAPTHTVPTMNDPAAVAALRDAKTDLVIDFGTGVLRPPVIEAAGNKLFNLHGGDPEDYRGLDTHLWAIYHKDFDGLITTLHRLDAGLDTGDIVLQSPIPLTSSMKLHALRAANTELCIALAKSLIDKAVQGDTVPSRHQRRAGRYYSAMPADLKSICQTRFEKHTAGLAHAS